MRWVERVSQNSSGSVTAVPTICLGVLDSDATNKSALTSTARIAGVATPKS